jgi:Coenzyme PQQ synthesis protein D (PqqD)
MADRVPRARDDLTVVELDGEAVIFDQRANRLHHLDPPSTVVFTVCDGVGTVDGLALEIAEVFDLEPVESVEHVRDAIRQLVEAGLVESLDG